jgi:hypothetical protein
MIRIRSEAEGDMSIVMATGIADVVDAEDMVLVTATPAL